MNLEDSDQPGSADILRLDARFVSLIKWLGENHIHVRLYRAESGGWLCGYRIREIPFGGAAKLSAEDGFLQFMIGRLLASPAPAQEIEDEDAIEDGDSMKLTSLQSITDFMTCAGRRFRTISVSGRGENLSVARSHEVSPGGAAPCTARPVHYDEYPVEEQLF